jgi:hypothetical protein
LEDSDEDFEGVNSLLVSSTDGPMIVSLEFVTSTAVEDEDVGCSAACTVFWDQDPVGVVLLCLTTTDYKSTIVLSRTLDEVTSILDARLQDGYDTSTFHYTKELVKDVLASVEADNDHQMSLVSLTVSLCHTIRSVSSSSKSGTSPDPQLTAVYDHDDDDDDEEEDATETVYTGQLVKGDLVGVIFNAVATLSDGQEYVDMLADDSCLCAAMPSASSGL